MRTYTYTLTALERSFLTVATQKIDGAFVSSFKLGWLHDFVDSGQNHWRGLAKVKIKSTDFMHRVNSMTFNLKLRLRGKAYPRRTVGDRLKGSSTTLEASADRNGSVSLDLPPQDLDSILADK